MTIASKSRLYFLKDTLMNPLSIRFIAYLLSRAGRIAELRLATYGGLNLWDTLCQL